MSKMEIAAAVEIGFENMESLRAILMTKLLARKTADVVRIGLLEGVDQAG